MTAKTITNTNCPIPNEGGFDDPSFPVFKLYRSSLRVIFHHYEQALVVPS